MGYMNLTCGVILVMTVAVSFGCSRVTPYKVPSGSGTPFVTVRQEDRNGDGIVDYIVMEPVKPSSANAVTNIIIVDEDYDGYYDKYLYCGDTVREEKQYPKTEANKASQVTSQ